MTALRLPLDHSDVRAYASVLSGGARLVLTRPRARWLRYPLGTLPYLLLAISAARRTAAIIAAGSAMPLPAMS